MSRIGKLPIQLPTGVNLKVTGRDVEVSGPKGTLKLILPLLVEIVSEGNTVKVKAPAEAGNVWGLARTLISNMAVGVTDGWSKTVELSGTGYRASVAGTDLNLALGFSHPVIIPAPSGIGFEVKDNKIKINGADKVLVGEVAAKIRHLRPADPYKAKGFKYEGEVIIRKAGKTAKAGTTTGK